MKDHYTIESISELREIIVMGKQQEDRLVERIYDHVDEHARRFILNSPLVFFATSNESGHVDVSPKGDAPGFIDILDNKTLVFPERLGNKDARNLRNIIENDQVSLLFLIPKTKEVLRVTGRATITKDPALLERMVSCGKPAVLCVKIYVQECFFHCGRAFNRSHLWVPEKWPESEGKYLRDQLVQEKNMNKQEIEALEKGTKDLLDELGESNGAY
jgi:PPOX class probable FMN-dependent enzyme